MIRSALALCLFAGAALAQGTVETLDPGTQPGGFVDTIDPNALGGRVTTFDEVVPAEPRVRVEAGTGAVIRWLDKVSGDVREIELGFGERQTLGRIEIELEDCRFPVNNPTGDAYAWLDIRTEGRDEADFSGWMLASSPALSALDHPRYDVWVIRCTTA